MFLDNLSVSILKLCDQNKLTYETASEKCDISSRYFGDIARGKTVPSVVTLEKLCGGFSAAPNELLLLGNEELKYRRPIAVSKIRCFKTPEGLFSYPICPTCGSTMEREYQNYCDRCGQKLDWSNLNNAEIIMY